MPATQIRDFQQRSLGVNELQEEANETVPLHERNLGKVEAPSELPSSVQFDFAAFSASGPLPSSRRYRRRPG